MDNIVNLIKEPWQEGWHEKARQVFEDFLKNGERYYKKAVDSLQIRCNKQNPNNKNEVPYLALINENNPASGPYGGMSFVVFPTLGSPCLFGMVVGTQGLAPDEKILGRPGHARKIGAVCQWLNNEYAENERIAWAKYDPCRTEKENELINEPLSVNAENGADEYQPILDKYGHVLYGMCHGGRMSEEAIEKALKAFLDLMLQERGVNLLKSAQEDANDIERNYLAYLFPSISTSGLMELLKDRRYVILEGPPGTGKTEMALEILEDYYQGSGNSIQFHPNVTYEEFIGGLKPVKTNDGVGFAFEAEPGTLMKAAAEAEEKNFLLHIDEINRADLPKVLGESIFLFEPNAIHERSITLPHHFGKAHGNTLRLPESLCVLGTMNTADRSIAILDIAIRRRFAFVKLWPQMNVVEEHGCSLNKDAFRRLLNIFVEYAPEEAFNLIPGHGYFTEKDETKAKNRLKTELKPLLEEYLEQGYVAGFSDIIRDYLNWLDVACKS